MNLYTPFASLKQSIESLKGKRRDDSWETAQKWKNGATRAIKEAFEGMDAKKDLLKRVDDLFNAAPIAIVVGMSPITPSQEENEESFQTEVTRAIALIDDCLAELSNLRQKFGSN